MGSIRLLPDILASQVAAGEVVERPASVVKELVENAIDAGATRITVEFQRGGTRLIRVTDDGSGMDRSDALLCLERHATSKIRESSDLAAITTLGFRGEAVPSIASVSRFRLATRRREDEAGTVIEVEGGKVRDVRDGGEAPGTRIEVADLFFNVPARRKFLRGEQTEAANLLQQVQSLATAHPEIAFTCIRDDREVFRLPATDDLAVRLRDLHGEQFLSKLVPVPQVEESGVSVKGWIARPGEGRSDRTLQMTFVNGRLVRSPSLSLPLREACDGVLPKGLHPPAVLFFVLDPSTVDCNVHPAKREVRFREPGALRAAALRAARAAWGTASVAEGSADLQLPTPPAWVGGKDPLFPPVTAWKPPVVATQHELPVQEVVSARAAETPDSFARVPSAFSLQPSAFSPRFLGQLAGNYLLFEQEEGLMLLEIRAARERIFFERFVKHLQTGELESQRLLMPEILEFGAADLAWVAAHEGVLRGAGLHAEPFGQGSLKVDAIPADAADLPVGTIVTRLIDELRTLHETPLLDQQGREALAGSVSRLAAAGARFPEGEEAARRLLRDLLACELPYATPRGRPTMVQMAPTELARRFQA
jgi:DNA mismatch repair protein MutL